MGMVRQEDVRIFTVHRSGGSNFSFCLLLLHSELESIRQCGGIPVMCHPIGFGTMGNGRKGMGERTGEWFQRCITLCCSFVGPLQYHRVGIKTCQCLT